MTIKEILELPDNHCVLSVNDLKVKTICSSKKHKRHQSDDGEIVQPVILTDGIDDVMAYIICPKGETIGRGWKLAFKGYVNKYKDGTRLDIVDWSTETATEPEPYKEQQKVHYTPAEIEQNKGTNWDEIARRGIRKDLVCAIILARRTNQEMYIFRFDNNEWTKILALTEKIFTGQ